MRTLMLAVVAVLALSLPLSAQDRHGICALNMGPLVEEVDNHVRSGNMGIEYACGYLQFDIGSGFRAGLLASYTKLLVWPNQGEELNRFSWRPKGAQETAFIWILPHIAYQVPILPHVALLPSVGLLAPVGLSYNWGAQVGPAYASGVTLSVYFGPFDFSATGMYVLKTKESWTVLHDYAYDGPTGDVKATSHIFPLSIGIGIRLP